MVHTHGWCTVGHSVQAYGTCPYCSYKLRHCNLSSCMRCSAACTQPHLMSLPEQVVVSQCCRIETVAGWMGPELTG
jgi:hypothetical protein